MKFLYTWGYDSSPRLKNIYSLIDTYSIDLFIDVRYKPYSSFSTMNKYFLEKNIKSYRWHGDLLGNVSQNLLNVKIANEGQGIKTIVDYFESYNKILIFCKESNYMYCHRNYISNKINSLYDNIYVLHIINENIIKVPKF